MTLVKQALVVLLGLVMAGVMVRLGVWQLHVYQSQGQQVAVQRAAAPPVDVSSVAAPGEEVGDAYGRTVRFTGHYDPGLQSYLADPGRPGHYRVLTAFRLDSGGALAVIRGVVDSKDAPRPPSGRLTQTGVLLPPDSADAQAEPGGQPTGVVLASLAQHWPIKLVNGYATLGAAEARQQSLGPATIALPTSSGRLQNGLYAMQWWVFAAFAIGMGVRMARDIGRGTQGTGSDPASASAESAGSGSEPDPEQVSALQDEPSRMSGG